MVFGKPIVDGSVGWRVENSLVRRLSMPLFIIEHQRCDGIIMNKSTHHVPFQSFSDEMSMLSYRSFWAIQARVTVQLPLQFRLLNEFYFRCNRHFDQHLEISSFKKRNDFFLGVRRQCTNREICKNVMYIHELRPLIRILHLLPSAWEFLNIWLHYVEIRQIWKCNLEINLRYFVVGWYWSRSLENFNYNFPIFL